LVYYLLLDYSPTERILLKWFIIFNNWFDGVVFGGWNFSELINFFFNYLQEMGKNLPDVTRVTASFPKGLQPLWCVDRDIS